MKREQFDRIGEWNPQFYREIKGKLKSRNLFYTVLISFLVQTFCFLPNLSTSSSNVGEWDVQWLFLNVGLDWVLPLALLIIGVYFLSSDVSREQQHGTLNFVRLSPRSSEGVLFGKLLGVPILLYLGVALALPLHLYSGTVSGIPLLSLFGRYILWGELCGVFYNFALLLVLAFDGKGERQKPIAGICSLLALMFAPTAIWTLQNANSVYHFKDYDSDWTWFFLPESLAYIWCLGTLFILNFWLWKATNRCFRNPTHTVITKTQSYWIVALTQLWFLGFALPDVIVDRDTNGGNIGAGLLFLFTPALVFFMAILLSPSRQNLLDWARYHQAQSSEKRPLLRDLLFGEKSPALAATALHFAIISVFWLPWIAMLIDSRSFKENSGNWGSNTSPLNLAIGLLITASTFFIYATIYQRIRFNSKNFHQAIARSIPWGFIIFSPAIAMILLQLSPEKAPLLGLFSPIAMVSAFDTSTTTLFLSFLAQIAILGLLARQLQRQLKRAGESQSKQLFNAVKIEGSL